MQPFEVMRQVSQKTRPVVIALGQGQGALEVGFEPCILLANPMSSLPDRQSMLSSEGGNQWDPQLTWRLLLPFLFWCAYQEVVGDNRFNRNEGGMSR